MSGPNSLLLPPPGLDPFSAPPVCQLPEVRGLVTFDRLGFQFTLNDAVYQRCWRAVARDAGATMVQARRAGECERMLNVGDALVRLWTSVKAPVRMDIGAMVATGTMVSGETSMALTTGTNKTCMRRLPARVPRYERHGETHRR